MQHYITATLADSKSALDSLMQNQKSLQAIEQAATTLISCLDQNNKIFSCGNGGSMSDAMHFAEELTGRYRKNRKGFSATAISDPGHISCVANDFGYDFIFARYLEACAKPGDCLLAISTSGNSQNVIKAAEYARGHGVKVISLCGSPDSTLGTLADIDIAVGPSSYADRIQELHIKVIHLLIELVERHFCPENY